MTKDEDVTEETYVLSDDRKIVGRLAGTEAVIIDFRTGVYYALTGAGVELWPLVEGGSRAAAITGAIAAAYGLAPADVAADVDAVLAALVASDLVRRDVDAVPGSVQIAPVDRPYEAPLLERFDDLAEAFAVDPPLDIGR